MFVNAIESALDFYLKSSNYILTQEIKDQVPTSPQFLCSNYKSFLKLPISLGVGVLRMDDYSLKPITKVFSNENKPERL